MILHADVASIIKECSENGDLETLRESWKLVQESYYCAAGPDKPGSELAVIAAEAFLKFEDTKFTKECLDIYFNEIDVVIDSESSNLTAASNASTQSSQKIDQYYIRALFIKGCLMQRSAVVDDGLKGNALYSQTLKAAQYIIQGIEMALSPSVLGVGRYSFLVFNGSVHFWRITHFLQCDGLRSMLLPHLLRVADALAAIDNNLSQDQKEWRARNLISLALCHIESKSGPSPSKTADADAQKCLESALMLTKNLSVKLEIESLKMRFFNSTPATKALSSAPTETDAFMMAQLKLVSIDQNNKNVTDISVSSKVSAPTSGNSNFTPTSITEIVSDLEKALYDLSFSKYRSLVLSSTTAMNLKKVQSTAAWIAAKKGANASLLQDLVIAAADCDDLKARLRAKLALCLHDYTQILEKENKMPDSNSDNPKSAVSIAHEMKKKRLKLLQQLEQILLGYIKTIPSPLKVSNTNPNPKTKAAASNVEPELTRGVHDSVKLVWNVSLPLLDPDLFSRGEISVGKGRGIVRACFRLATKALDGVHSNNSYLRASMHMELAQHVIENPNGAIVEACNDIEKSLSFEYRTMKSATADGGEQSLHEMLFERKLDRYLIPLKKVVESLQKDSSEDNDEDLLDNEDELLASASNPASSTVSNSRFLDEAMILIEQSRRARREKRRKHGLLTQALDALQDFDDSAPNFNIQSTDETDDSNENESATPPQESVDPTSIALVRWNQYRRTSLYGCITSLAYESEMYDIVTKSASRVLQNDALVSKGSNPTEVGNDACEKIDEVDVDCMCVASEVCFLLSKMYLNVLKAHGLDFVIPSDFVIEEEGEVTSTSILTPKPNPICKTKDALDYSSRALRYILRGIKNGQRIHEVIQKASSIVYTNNEFLSKGITQIKNGATLLWNSCLQNVVDGASDATAVFEEVYKVLERAVQSGDGKVMREEMDELPSLLITIGHVLACGYERRYLSLIERTESDENGGSRCNEEYTKSWQLCENLLKTIHLLEEKTSTTKSLSKITRNHRQIVCSLARLSAYTSPATTSNPTTGPKGAKGSKGTTSSSPLDTLSTIMKNDTDAAIALIELASRPVPSTESSNEDASTTTSMYLEKALTALQKISPPDSADSEMVDIEMWTRLARAAYEHSNFRMAIKCAKSVTLSKSNPLDIEECYWLSIAHHILALSISSLTVTDSSSGLATPATELRPKYLQLLMLSVLEMKNALSFAVKANRKDLIERVCRCCWNLMIPLLTSPNTSVTPTASDTTALLSILHEIIRCFPFDSSTSSESETDHHDFRMGLLRAIMSLYERLSQAPHPNTQSHGLIEGLRVLDSSEFTQLFPPSMSNELVKQKIKLWMKLGVDQRQLSVMTNSIKMNHKSRTSTAISNSGTAFIGNEDEGLYSSDDKREEMSNIWSTIAHKLPSTSNHNLNPTHLDMLKNKYIYYHKSIVALEDVDDSSSGSRIGMKMRKVCDLVEWMMTTITPNPTTTSTVSKSFFNRVYVNNYLSNQLRNGLRSFEDKYDSMSLSGIAVQEYSTDMMNLIRASILSVRTTSEASFAADSKPAASEVEDQVLLAQQLCSKFVTILMDKSGVEHQEGCDVYSLYDFTNAATMTMSEDVAGSFSSRNVDCIASIHCLLYLLERLERLYHYNLMMPVCFLLWLISRALNGNEDKSTIDNNVTMLAEAIMIRVVSMLKVDKNDFDGESNSSISGFQSKINALLKSQVIVNNSNSDDDENAVTSNLTKCGISIPHILYEHARSLMTANMYVDARDLLKRALQLYGALVPLPSPFEPVRSSKLPQVIGYQQCYAVSLHVLGSRLCNLYLQSVLASKTMDSNDQFITDCLSKLLDTNGSGSIEDIPKLTSIVKECIGRWRWRLLKKKTGGATPFEIKTDMIGFIDMQIKSIFARHATMKKPKENVDVRLSCESVIAVAELLFEKAALLLEWPEGDDTESPISVSRSATEKLKNYVGGINYIVGIKRHVQIVLSYSKTDLSHASLIELYEDAVSLIHEGLTYSDTIKSKYTMLHPISGDDFTSSQTTYTTPLDLIHVELYHLLIYVKSKLVLEYSSRKNNMYVNAFPKMTPSHESSGTFINTNESIDGAKAVESFLVNATDTSLSTTTPGPSSNKIHSLINSMIIDANSSIALLNVPIPLVCSTKLALVSAMNKMMTLPGTKSSFMYANARHSMSLLQSIISESLEKQYHQICYQACTKMIEREAIMCSSPSSPNLLCCELLTLAQALKARSELVDAFTSMVELHNAETNIENRNKDYYLINLNNEAKTQSNDYITSTVNSKSSMIANFINGVDAVRLTSSPDETSSSKPRVCMSDMLSSVPPDTVVLCLHMDSTREDIITDYSKNDDINKRYLRCCAMESSNLTPTPTSTPASKESNVAPPAALDPKVSVRLDLGISSDTVAELLEMARNKKKRALDRSNPQKDDVEPEDVKTTTQANVSDKEKEVEPMVDSKRDALDDIAVVDWEDFHEKLEHAFKSFSDWLVPPSVDSTMPSTDSPSPTDTETSPPNPYVWLSEAFSVNTNKQCLLLIDSELHELPLESLKVFRHLKAIFRDFSLCFAHNRSKLSKTVHANSASSGKVSAPVDSMKLNEFKYIVDEDNFGNFTNTVLPMFGSAGSGGKGNASSPAVDGICIPSSSQGPLRDQENNKTNSGTVPSSGDVWSLLESTKGFIYHASSLFSAAPIPDSANIRSNKAPIHEPQVTLSGVCGADLSKCRVALLLGGNSKSISNSLLPIQLLSLRGVGGIVMTSHMLDNSTSTVCKHAGRMLHAATEGGTGGKNASASGKWIQEIVTKSARDIYSNVDDYLPPSFIVYGLPTKIE